MKIEDCYWWFLKKSRIFKYFYGEMLTELCFELQREDFTNEREAMLKKYSEKLKKVKSS